MLSVKNKCTYTMKHSEAQVVCVTFQSSSEYMGADHLLILAEGDIVHPAHNSYANRLSRTKTEEVSGG
jgi:hypothetical protein